jgi:hypothetical protein
MPISLTVIIFWIYIGYKEFFEPISHYFLSVIWLNSLEMIA